MIEFIPFQKIGRFSRDCTITEKLDGTNASIYIGENGEFLTGSRTRWITPEDDNYNFSKWAHENKDELMGLGIGHHLGEWYGKGIQRNYSLTEKRFALFNTFRWKDDAEIKRPNCCYLVPILYEGPFEEHGVFKGLKNALTDLSINGSKASLGFMKPEGVIIYHHATKQYFKKTLEKDEKPKGSRE